MTSDPDILTSSGDTERRHDGALPDAPAPRPRRTGSRGAAEAAGFRSVDEVPFVYRYNLCAAALELFLEEYNQRLRQTASHATAREHAIATVKRRFTRDRRGVWAAGGILEGRAGD